MHLVHALVQDHGIFIAKELEMLQACSKWSASCEQAWYNVFDKRDSYSNLARKVELQPFLARYYAFHIFDHIMYKEFRTRNGMDK